MPKVLCAYGEYEGFAVVMLFIKKSSNTTKVFHNAWRLENARKENKCAWRIRHECFAVFSLYANRYKLKAISAKNMPEIFSLDEIGMVEKTVSRYSTFKGCCTLHLVQHYQNLAADSDPNVLCR